MNNDIIKAVVYDRGMAKLNIDDSDNKAKYVSLVAMVIVSDRPIATEHNPEVVLMGACDIVESLNQIKKYNPPYKLGDISHAIVDISRMAPHDLEEIE